MALNLDRLPIICIVNFSVGLCKKKKREKILNPGFVKYCVPLQYTQSICGAALKDDFNYNKTEDVLSSDFTKS
jgi:hypothetical protein